MAGHFLLGVCLLQLALGPAAGAGVRQGLRSPSFGMVFPAGQRYTGGPDSAETTEALAMVDAAKSVLSSVQLESDKATDALHAARSGYKLVQKSKIEVQAQLKATPSNETLRERDDSLSKMLTDSSGRLEAAEPALSKGTIKVREAEASLGKAQRTLNAIRLGYWGKQGEDVPADVKARVNAAQADLERVEKERAAGVAQSAADNKAFAEAKDAELKAKSALAAGQHSSKTSPAELESLFTVSEGGS